METLHGFKSQKTNSISICQVQHHTWTGRKHKVPGSLSQLCQGPPIKGPVWEREECLLATLGFLHRNLRVTSVATNPGLHIFTPTSDYACPVWSPHTTHDTHQIEIMQHTAARWVSGKIFTVPTYKLLLNLKTFCRFFIPNETTFTKYCFTQWIQKLPVSFEIQ